MTTPALPSGLPDAAFVVSTRMQAAAPLDVSKLTDNYTIIAAIALDCIARDTGLVFYDGTEGDATKAPPAILAEPMYFSGRVPWVVPAYWPVVSIERVLGPGGASAMSTGSVLDVARGAKQLAIRDGGQVIGVAPGALFPGAEVYVDYSAGLATLPANLVEVFTELCWLIGQEPMRVGQTSQKSDVMETRFTRALPDWAKRALSGYRRVQVFV